jgi:hypothetical protein
VCKSSLVLILRIQTNLFRTKEINFFVAHKKKKGGMWGCEKRKLSGEEKNLFAFKERRQGICVSRVI